ncbi:MAG: hypothetical protein R2829_10025 [Bacteroidia bacterium]
MTIISQQDVGCIGGSDGSVTIGASGGTANYDSGLRKLFQ